MKELEEETPAAAGEYAPELLNRLRWRRVSFSLSLSYSNVRVSHEAEAWLLANIHLDKAQHEAAKRNLRDGMDSRCAGQSNEN